MKVFITYLALSLSAIWCGDYACSFCDKGYLIQSKMCIAKCPSYYQTSELTMKCTPETQVTLVDLNFTRPYSFNISKIGIFNSLDGLPLLSSPQISPLPTKDRGLFFRSTSKLISFENLIISPFNRVSYYIKVFSPGEIFSAVHEGLTLISLTTNMTYFNHSFLLSSISVNKTLSVYRNHGTTWDYKYISGFYDSGGYKVHHGGTLLGYFPDFEFRSQYSNTILILGSSTNSFVGFIFKFQVLNNNNGDIFFAYNENNCHYSEYLFDLNCYSCNTTCETWPVCVRNSCNLCYSENCTSCSGYLISDCTNYTNSYPDSFPGYKCLNGSQFNCLECEAGYELNNGLCIFKPYSTQDSGSNPALVPVINAKFKKHSIASR